MSVTWIEHKGKRILYADFRGQMGQEALATLELGAKMAAASPTKVLMLSNYEGATATTEWFARVKQLGKEVFDQRVEKDAAAGVTGVKRVPLVSCNRITRKASAAVDTEAEALDWLVKD